MFASYDILARLTKWTLPALSTLALVLEASHSLIPMPDLKSFLQAHGRYIKTLTVKFGHREETALPLLHMLKFCPAVRDLSFLFRRINQRLPPALYLNRLSFVARLSAIDDSMHTIYTMDRPSLNIIWLRGIRFTQLEPRERNQPIWVEWACKWAKEGVTVVDDDGIGLASLTAEPRWTSDATDSV
jgi:hypothetical protein